MDVKLYGYWIAYKDSFEILELDMFETSLENISWNVVYLKLFQLNLFLRSQFCKRILFSRHLEKRFA